VDGGGLDQKAGWGDGFGAGLGTGRHGLEYSKGGAVERGLYREAAVVV